jgi:hypothetical protein
MVTVAVLNADSIFTIVQAIGVAIPRCFDHSDRYFLTLSTADLRREIEFGVESGVVNRKLNVFIPIRKLAASSDLCGAGEVACLESVVVRHLKHRALGARSEAESKGRARLDSHE